MARATSTQKPLPNGEPNNSPSGDPRPEVKQEAGVQPVKAVHLIRYGDAKDALPGAIFTPVSQEEREALLVGDDPAAVELTEDERKLFGYENADSGDFA